MRKSTFGVLVFLISALGIQQALAQPVGPRVHAYVQRLNPPVIGLQNYERSRSVSCTVEADFVVSDSRGKLAHHRVTTRFKALPPMYQVSKLSPAKRDKRWTASKRALLGSVTQVRCG